MMDIKMEEGTSSSPIQQDGLIVSSSSIQKIPSPSNNNGNRSTLTKIQSSMSKRQQAAHKARMEALSFQLKTRLQYAMFKVEHGWAKQSLSEVENLYYKHRRASGSGLGGNNTKRSSPQTQRSGSGSQSQQQQKHLFLPSTPTPQSRTTSPIAVRKQSMSNNTNSTTEAFGGLVTPPPSGGTLPINHERYKDLFSSSTGGNHSFSSGLTNQQSPSIHNTKINTGQSQNSSSAKKTGKSYADFWSKIGSTNNNNNGNQTENNRSSS